MAEKEYIDRGALIKTCEEIIQIRWNEITAPVSWSHAYADFIEDIENQPAADVAPVRHGCWENPTKKFPYYDWKCSECGCEEYRHIDRHGQYREMNFCPNCGAKMDRSEND